MLKYIFLICLFACLSLRADIVISGSDLFDELMSPALRVYADTTSLPVKVNLIGSQPGMVSLREGEADLALVALPDGIPEDREGFTYHPLAFKVAMVAVHKDNPMTEISLPQLAGIFSAQAPDYFSEWEELGQSGRMSGRTIQPIVLSQPESVLLELFKYRALRSSAIKQDIPRMERRTLLHEQLMGDVRCIALTDTPPPANVGRVLSLSTGQPGSFAYDPKPENVYYGDYPVSLSFYLVYRKDRQSLLEDLLMLFYSEDFSQMIDDNGFMVLPSKFRKRILSDILSERALEQAQSLMLNN